jgi:hypothetical protein
MSNGLSIAATFMMKAIVVTDQAAGRAGMKLVERPEPQGARLASLSGANYGDVVVQVHASGFTWDELSWPSTWIDRLCLRPFRSRSFHAPVQRGSRFDPESLAPSTTFLCRGTSENER